MDTREHNNDAVISIREFARLIGVRPMTIIHHIRANRIKTSVREVVGIPMSEVKAFSKWYDVHKRK